MDFIIDRTSEDVAYAQSFIGEIWNKMSNAQQEEWLKGMTTPLESLKGFFNYTDMNRIKNNYNTLRTNYNYTENGAISTTYDISTIPNWTTMSEHFSDIQDFGLYNYIPYIKGASFSDYRTPHTLSFDVNRIDYNFLNNYEHILKNLYDYYTDGELYIDCEFIPYDDYVGMDGYLYQDTEEVSGGRVYITVPDGFVFDIIRDSQHQYCNSTTDKEVLTGFSEEHDNIKLKIYNGITNEKTIVTDNSTGVTIDVSMYDEVVLDTDLLAYNSNVDYTATDIQSSMIDVSSCTQMYVYNLSDYGGDIIITTYDENEDVIDEFALTTDLQIDLTDVYYFTIDSSVGDTLSYMTSVGNYFDWFYVTVGNNPVKRFPVDYNKPFDVSGESTLKIQSHQPYSDTTKCLFNVQKSIEGGLDISQLDTSEIEIKYM